MMLGQVVQDAVPRMWHVKPRPWGISIQHLAGLSLFRLEEIVEWPTYYIHLIVALRKDISIPNLESLLADEINGPFLASGRSLFR